MLVAELLVLDRSWQAFCNRMRFVYSIKLFPVTDLNFSAKDDRDMPTFFAMFSNEMDWDGSLIILSQQRSITKDFVLD